MDWRSRLSASERVSSKPLPAPPVVSLKHSQSALPATVSVSPVPARPADSPARLEGGQGGARARRAGADLAAATGLLIVALGLAGFGSSFVELRRAAVPRPA